MSGKGAKGEMIRLFIVVLILLTAIPAYGEPEIGSFDITYSEFKILHDPIVITFVNQYCESKKITIDEVKVTDVDKLIDTYAFLKGYETPMPEILDMLIDAYGKPNYETS